MYSSFGGKNELKQLIHSQCICYLTIMLDELQISIVKYTEYFFIGNNNYVYCTGFCSSRFVQKHDLYFKYSLLINTKLQIQFSV